MPLPEPRGRQREVLYLPAEGHVAVLGTAGSGKTTLAIHRSIYLANGRLPHAGRTLLLTFNVTLATYLRHLGEGTTCGVVVENYHRFARGYLSARGKMPRVGGIADSQVREALIEEAVARVRADSDSPVLKRSTPFLSEEIAWIAKNQVASLDDYLLATRTGRLDARVGRKSRPVLWAIREEYLNLRAGTNCLYDWDDMACAVCDELDHDDGERLYRHVVIDEGQDFSPAMIRSLTKAVPPGGSVTFFGDVAQQIFGRRMSWRGAGLTISKIWKFEDNYRNSPQIARLAMAIAKMPYYRDEADLIEPKTFAADGPPPTVVRCANQADEVAFILRQAKAAAGAQSVAILVRRREDEDAFKPGLPKGSVRLHRNMPSWQTGPRIHYGTYHAAKGLEFDMVILPFFGRNRMPDPKEIERFGGDEATAQDGRLLYVGVTRARSNLVITHVGDRSELLPTVPGLMHEEAP